MKILHVIPHSTHRYGGPAKVCHDLSKALAQNGHEVVVYTTNCDYPTGKLPVPLKVAVKKDGYTVFYFPVQLLSYMFSWDMWCALRRHAKEFDVIHIHGIYRFPQAVAAYFARKYNVPYLICPHGSLDPFLYNRKANRLVKRLYESLIEKRNLRLANAIHYTTEEEMFLTQELGIRGTSAVIPNGLDLSEFSALPEPGQFRKKYNLGQAPIVLFVGRLNFVKGLDLLVKAFAQVARSQPDTRLVLCGPDNEGYSAQINKWLEAEGIGEKTVLTGMLDKKALLTAYRDAELFILPSYSDSFGMSAVEAMACGLPVIVSDKVKICQVIKSHNAGIITACDVGELTRAMNELLNDQNTRHHMGEAGRVLVKEKYALNSILQKLLNLYASIIKKGTT